jgi:hypothetical protein
MQFYPHNIPLTTIGSAVSSSLAKSGSYIANFAAVPVTTVNTASLALNIVGTAGVNGTGVVVPGPKGATGIRGVTGPRGNNVYLLSSSWHDESKVGATCPPAPSTCWQVDLYSAYIVFGQGTCDYSTNPPYNPVTYYTTSGSSQLEVDQNFGAGFPLYANSTCTDTLLSVLGDPVSVLGSHALNGKGQIYGLTSLSSASLNPVVCTTSL